MGLEIGDFTRCDTGPFAYLPDQCSLGIPIGQRNALRAAILIDARAANHGSPFAGIEHMLSIEIVKQANVIVSTPRGGLVETNRGDGREVLLSVRLIDVMIRGCARRARR